MTITFALRLCARGGTRRFTLLVAGDHRAWAPISCSAPGREWHHLIYDKGLTIQTNLFGTTFYSLVGLHATHVVVGLSCSSIVHGVRARWRGRRQSITGRTEVLALYWHFVDVIWIVVFTVVYIIGR